MSYFRGIPILLLSPILPHSLERKLQNNPGELESKGKDYVSQRYWNHIIREFPLFITNWRMQSFPFEYTVPVRILKEALYKEWGVISTRRNILKPWKWPPEIFRRYWIIHSVSVNRLTEGREKSSRIHPRY